MKTGTFLSVICVILLSLTQLWAQDEDLQREQVARYDLNNASYLIEIGKYMEALENYDAAFEMTDREKTKIEALLGKATLLSTFLDAPEESLKVYRELYAAFPAAREIARYREGLLLFHLERTDEAREVLKNYLQQYPEGRFRFQAEALLEQIKIEVPPPPPPPPPACGCEGPRDSGQALQICHGIDHRGIARVRLWNGMQRAIPGDGSKRPDPDQ